MDGIDPVNPLQPLNVLPNIWYFGSPEIPLNNVGGIAYFIPGLFGSSMFVPVKPLQP